MGISTPMNTLVGGDGTLQRISRGEYNARLATNNAGELAKLAARRRVLEKAVIVGRGEVDELAMVEVQMKSLRSDLDAAMKANDAVIARNAERAEAREKARAKTQAEQQPNTSAGGAGPLPSLSVPSFCSLTLVPFIPQVHHMFLPPNPNEPKMDSTCVCMHRALLGKRP